MKIQGYAMCQSNAGFYVVGGILTSWCNFESKMNCFEGWLTDEGECETWQKPNLDFVEQSFSVVMAMWLLILNNFIQQTVS